MIKNKFHIFTVLSFLLAYALPLNAADNIFSAVSDDYWLSSSQVNKKVSLDFKNADLADVLKIFSQQSGKNFIASQEVGDRKVTLFLDNIPVEEALTKILDANNLRYEADELNGIFIVKQKEKRESKIITKIFMLRYASVASSKLNNTISITGNARSLATSKQDPLKLTEDVTASKSKAESGIGSILKTILSPAGSVVEDARTNSLIVTDVEDRFPSIETTIAQLDVPIPQILIEVEMLDVSKANSDKIGVQYGETPLTFSGAQRDLLYPFNQNKVIDKGDAETPAYRVGTLSAAGLQATLQFLRSRTDTKNLARPRLMTLNNETAEIKISTDEAIGISTKTDSSQSTATQSVQAERVQTGVFLKVTPQVYLGSREIVMAIAPKVIQARRSGESFGGQIFKDPEERGAQAVLRVNDGQTIIFGGLLRTDESNTVTKVPVLGDAPFIGGLFRHKNQSNTERELIIFITPHIVDDSSLTKASRKSRELINDSANYFDRQEAVSKELSILEK